MPFCRSLCPYCPYTRVPYEPGLAAGFAGAVVGEAANPVEVSFNGTIAEAFELDKA